MRTGWPVQDTSTSDGDASVLSTAREPMTTDACGWITPPGAATVEPVMSSVVSAAPAPLMITGRVTAMGEAVASA